MYCTKFISPNLVDLLRISEGIHRRVTGIKNEPLKKDMRTYYIHWMKIYKTI